MQLTCCFTRAIRDGSLKYRSLSLRIILLLLTSLLNWELKAQDQAPPEQAEIPEVEANSAASSSEAPLYPSREMRNKSLLAKSAGEEAQWLDTDYNKLLALYRPSEAQETHGAMVLFHAAADPQTWPSILENLRATLPRFGWETLAITLPVKAASPLPQRESTPSAPASAVETETENATETTVITAPPAASSSLSSIVPRDRLIQAYVDAAFRFLAAKENSNLVVLVDNSAASAVLLHIASQFQEDFQKPNRSTGPTQAVIIANLQSQEPLSTEELTQVFAHKHLPVLEVFFAPETPEQKRARDNHRGVAMRQRLKVYQQALLADQPKKVESDPRSFLVARVRGFIQRHTDPSANRKASETE